MARSCLVGIAALMFAVTTAAAQVLFEDDFESGKIDDATWVPTDGWEIAANEDGPAVLGEFYLDIWGGHEALSVPTLPEEYDYYADVYVHSGGYGQFILNAQDLNDLYMHQVDVAGATPKNIRWHRKVGGYTMEATPFENDFPLKMKEWFRVKFEVSGFSFKAYLGEVGARSENMVFVAQWEDPLKAFVGGMIGFRQWGDDPRGAASPERNFYDNILVVEPGTAIPLAVTPQRKLAVAWGALERAE